MTAAMTYERIRPEEAIRMARADPQGADVEPGMGYDSEWSDPGREIGPSSYRVDLGDAMGKWQWDYLYEVPLVAHFDDFEEAKRYVVENLTTVVRDLTRIVGEVRTARSFENLDLSCCNLIT